MKTSRKLFLLFLPMLLVSSLFGGDLQVKRSSGIDVKKIKEFTEAAYYDPKFKNGYAFLVYGDKKGNLEGGPSYKGTDQEQWRSTADDIAKKLRRYTVLYKYVTAELFYETEDKAKKILLQKKGESKTTVQKTLSLKK